MRIVLDEGIPRELTAEFAGQGDSVAHVADLGLSGTRDGDLKAAISGTTDVSVTGDIRTSVFHGLASVLGASAP